MSSLREVPPENRQLGTSTPRLHPSRILRSEDVHWVRRSMTEGRVEGREQTWSVSIVVEIRLQTGPSGGTRQLSRERF